MMTKEVQAMLDIVTQGIANAKKQATSYVDPAVRRVALVALDDLAQNLATAIADHRDLRLAQITRGRFLDLCGQRWEEIKDA